MHVVMFMTRKREIRTMALPLVPRLKIFRTIGHALSAVLAKICFLRNKLCCFTERRLLEIVLQ